MVWLPTLLHRRNHSPSCSTKENVARPSGEEKLQVKVPRSCLSSPSKVKLGNLYYLRTTTADGLDYYLDNTIPEGTWASWINRDY